MDKLCVYYSALKFKNETPGMCCEGGKVKLQELYPIPEPTSNLVSIETFLGKHTQIQLHGNIQSARANLSSCWITALTDADHKFISW